MIGEALITEENGTVDCNITDKTVASLILGENLKFYSMSLVPNPFYPDWAAIIKKGKSDEDG